jgi:hypothetical protein
MCLRRPVLGFPAESALIGLQFFCMFNKQGQADKADILSMTGGA